MLTPLAPLQLPSDFRIPAPDSLSARRSARALHVPKATSPAGLAGLRYEKRVRMQLQKHLAAGKFLSLEHNPWFSFSDEYGAHACSPDFLLWPTYEAVVIIEVKLTWVASAARKLWELYMPVVNAALDVPVAPLIICRNILPETPPTSQSFREAVNSPARILQYFDNGPLLW